MDIVTQSTFHQGGYVTANMSYLDTIQRLYALSDSELKMVWMAWQAWAELTSAEQASKMKRQAKDATTS